MSGIFRQMIICLTDSPSRQLLLPKTQVPTLTQNLHELTRNSRDRNGWLPLSPRPSIWFCQVRMAFERIPKASTNHVLSPYTKLIDVIRGFRGYGAALFLANPCQLRRLKSCRKSIASPRCAAQRQRLRSSLLLVGSQSQTVKTVRTRELETYTDIYALS